MPNIKDVFYFVEADDFARHELWLKHNKLFDKWTQEIGRIETIGELDGRPVCVALMYSYINDHLICFYEATSQIVDHEMVRNWLEEQNPICKNSHCNASNFHQCVIALKELNQ